MHTGNTQGEKSSHPSRTDPVSAQTEKTKCLHQEQAKLAADSITEGNHSRMKAYLRHYWKLLHILIATDRVSIVDCMVPRD